MIRLLFSLFLVLSFRAFTQEVPVLLQQASRLESDFKEEDALVKYQEILRTQPRNVFALCRCSDLSCRIGNRQDVRDKKITYFKAGHDYADAAWHLDSTSSEANVVMALRPDFMLNYLELARACHRDGQGAGAVQPLRRLDSLKDGMYDDRRVRSEGRQLLTEWE